MLVQHSFDIRFVSLMEKLRKKFGESMFELEGIGDKHLDINKYSQDFFGSKGNTADKSIDGNANVSDSSVLSWEHESSKPIKKLNSLYILWKNSLAKFGIKRANKMIEAELRGSIRIHDLFLFLRPYCWAGSLEPVVNKGMPFYDKIKIGAVQHFDSYFNLSLQYISYISNQMAGAVALPDFFVWMDYFVRKDYGENWHDDQKIIDHVNQQFQCWIYSVNFSWRSNQSPFTNLSVMDKYWLEGLFSNYVFPNMSKPNFDNISRLQEMFVKEYSRNLKNNPFTFPVMTACMLWDKETQSIKDEKFLDMVSEITAENALFNFYVSETVDSLSSCCRLRSSIEQANKEYMNSFGAGGLNIGSHRVVTLNLPQLAYEHETWEELMKTLEYRISLSQDILDVHRETIQHLIDIGRLPMYNYGYMSLDKQFSTIGFIGMNECLEIMGFDIRDEAGALKAKEILDLINAMNLKRSKIDGKIRNVEQVPGEDAASNLAKKDAILFPERSIKYDLYSNQYIPLVKEASIVDRIIAQGRFDKECGGGSILHLNMQDKVTQKQVKKLLSFTASKGVVYFALNYNFCKCVSCGQVHVGKYDKSPCHNAEVRKFLRVVGFLTEVANWTPARREEYKKRQFYGADKLNPSKVEKNERIEGSKAS